MFSEFVKKSMSKARYELLSIEEGYYGEIPGYEGVWANGKDIDECKRELQEVLEEWISLKITKKTNIPHLDFYSLNEELIGQN